MNAETHGLLQLLAEWLAAIGTLLAVVVALYLSRRDKLIRCVAGTTIYQLLEAGRAGTPEYVALTVTNIGTRSFIVTGLSWRSGVFKKKYFFVVPPQNEFTSHFPAKLADGEQASIYIPLEAFRVTSVPTILSGKPKYFLRFWIRFMRLIVHTTTGEAIKFKIHKTVRAEIIARGS